MRDVKGQHSNSPLSDLTEKLRIEYYESIERLCTDAREQVEKIRTLDPTRIDPVYLRQCHSVMDSVAASLAERRDRFVPYLQRLWEKVATEHNCTNCSGSCKLDHDIQLFDLSAATKKLKSIQGELQLLSLPLYSETLFPDQYRVLRNLLALIESDIVELFFLEENYLIPKVIAAQKAINVSGR
ncbi:hypothetical protein GCM10023093_20480 [Nemorincola caseinilytica]|uniref:Uncharacterized protein n=1 Tax=Nemorincola caseinilytica TaxID=2054315 RepID=A0ABP8NG51_9BACT